MGLFKTLKRNAKRALSGNWGRAILMMMIVTIPMFLVGVLEFAIRQISGISEYSGSSGLTNSAPASLAISLLVAILIFLILTPLQQGDIRWYYRRAGGEQDSLTTIFCYFETVENFFRSLWLHFQIGLRTFLWAMLLIFPFTLMFGGYFYMTQTAQSAPSWATRMFMMALLFVWTAIFTIVVALISLRYFLAPYLYAQNPQLKARAAIKQSIRLTRGHKGRLFLFGLSFIPWYLPTVGAIFLVFTILFNQSPLYLIQVMGFMILLLVAQFGLCFYLVPYSKLSFALYARYLIESSARDDFSNRDSTREYRPEIDRYLEQERAAEQTHAPRKVDPDDWI